MPFDTNPVGRTDVKVTALSLGGASIGNLGRAIGDDDARAVMDHAWGAGIRYFDTAPFYGRGLSEQRMGDWLRTRPRDGYTLSTKVGRVLSPGEALEEADGFVRPAPNAIRYDYSADGIRESFETSCERMGTNRIDIAFVHDIGDLTHGREAGARHMDDLLGSGMGALRDLKREGRIGAIGLGVNECRVCLDVMAHEPLDAILLAGRLTLYDRSAEAGLLDLCAARGTSLILGGIFNSGILATGSVPGAWFDYAPASAEVMEGVAALKERVEALGMTLPQAALRFGLEHRTVASVLIGTGRVASLRRNLEAVAAPLSDEARAFLAS